MLAPEKLTATAVGLRIIWGDGRVDDHAWTALRRACPCATCRAEKERPPAPPSLLPVITAAEAQPLKAKAVVPMGNYAYGIHFSDGHATGIYSWDYLRALGDRGLAPGTGQ